MLVKVSSSLQRRIFDALQKNNIPVYSGYCTCGYDDLIRDWMRENPHSRGCTGTPCVCGIDSEMARWDDGRWHGYKCRKSEPTVILHDIEVYAYQCPPGVYLSEPMPDTELIHWLKKLVPTEVAA